MILSAWRLLRALSLPQYIGTLLTVLLPVVPVSALNLTTTTLLIIYAGWSMCAILIIAAVFREQRVDVDQRISRRGHGPTQGLGEQARRKCSDNSRCDPAG